jgi:hypothetical protein
MRIPCSGVDYFHHLLHRLIRDHGGSGNHGQVRLELDQALESDRLEHAWRQLGRQAWILGAQLRLGLRGAWWQVRGPAELAVARGSDVAQLAQEHLRLGLEETGPRLRLGYADGQCTGRAGVVLTWDHRLCDARAALGVLARLPQLAAGHSLRDPWWAAGQRQLPGLPRTRAAQGALARQSVQHLKPHRYATLWRPQVPPGNPAAPVEVLHLAFTAAETAGVDQRQVTASGRFAETPFLLAALTAALEDVGGIRGDALFPVAIDARPRQGGALLANCHSFLFLRLQAGMASRDLTVAARALKQAHRDWVEQEMSLKMACAMEFFPLVGERIARAQLGYFRAGVAASCLVANTGQTSAPGELFGAQVTRISHAATVPGMPGLAALFHRQGRRLCCDLIAAGAVRQAMPLARLRERLRHQLLERPLQGPAQRGPGG